jgi:lipoic acid synthetase
MGLYYVVITSVTRDDLADGGAGLFARTIREIRERSPETLVEVLVPDFQGDADALHEVLGARPDVLNHNLETVPRLYPSVRPEAVYRRSLELLERVEAYDPAIPTKSGLMLGLGESPEEIDRTLRDLRRAGCDLLTLGQYLQPTRRHLPVRRFVHPDEFEEWRRVALDLGFAEVASGPFVRSSYRAEAFYQAVRPSPVQAL